MLTSCSFAKNDLAFCRHKLSSSAIATRSTRSFKAAASISLTQGTKGAMIEQSLNPERPMELYCLQILRENIVFQLVPRVRPLKRCSRPWISSGYYRKLMARENGARLADLASKRIASMIRYSETWKKAR